MVVADGASPRKNIGKHLRPPVRGIGRCLCCFYHRNSKDPRWIEYRMPAGFTHFQTQLRCSDWPKWRLRDLAIRSLAIVRFPYQSLNVSNRIQEMNTSFTAIHKSSRRIRKLGVRFQICGISWKQYTFYWERLGRSNSDVTRNALDLVYRQGTA